MQPTWRIWILYSKNIHNFFNWLLENFLTNLDQIPEEIRTAVKNNGGGVFNHNLYWAAMTKPHDGKPLGSLAQAIDTAFSSFDQFKIDFEKAGVGRFGSGYTWLCVNSPKKLIIHSTSNQDSPLQENLQPLLVVDVWEHAYYLKY